MTVNDYHNTATVDGVPSLSSFHQNDRFRILRDRTFVSPLSHNLHIVSGYQ